MRVEISSAPEGPLIVDSALAPGTALSVIVPTFREEENIGPFLTALCGDLDTILPGSYEIVVVVDDSPDLTLEKAAEIAATHPQIRLVRRTRKRELATAVIRGWQVASGDVLATINADFQHPPAMIARMWKLVQNVDLVVASRYCEGGGVGNWSPLRRRISQGAQLLGRILLPEVFGRVSDPLSGCFMFYRKTLIGVELNPIGYKMLIEVLTRGRVTSIAELPYHMRARERGRSKASGARSLDFAMQLLRLRKALREAGR